MLKIKIRMSRIFSVMNNEYNMIWICIFDNYLQLECRIWLDNNLLFFVEIGTYAVHLWLYNAICLELKMIVLGNKYHTDIYVAFSKEIQL